jgi:hypothetical protein
LSLLGGMKLRLFSLGPSTNDLMMTQWLPTCEKSCACSLIREGKVPVHLILFVLLGLTQPVESHIVVHIPLKHISDLGKGSVL